MLHVTPIMDYIGIGEIAKATHNDETLSELGKIYKKIKYGFQNQQVKS